MSEEERSLISMITSKHLGGLSNRIKSLVSCIRYSQKHNTNYYVYWKALNSYKTNNHILNCSFYKLFSNKIEITYIDKKSKIYSSHCLMIENDDNIPKNFCNFQSKCSKKFTPNDKFGRNIDFAYNKIPHSIKNDYINAFHILKPIPELVSRINDFSKNKFDENTISVHIRSWNRPNEGSRRKPLFNMQLFENKMKQYNKKYKFFLATDSQTVKYCFNNSPVFKDRIITYPRKTNLNKSRSNPKGIQEDLIELYLLSKNKIMIGSHFSTFSEVAWWLGDCPKDITIL